MNILNNLSRSTLYSILEQLWQPVAVADCENKILWQNESFTNLTNRDLAGSHASELNEIGISYKINQFHEEGSPPVFLIFPEINTLISNHQNLKNAAHDFKNILTSIHNSLELLKQKVKNRSEVSFLLENIGNCTSRAAELTESLLPQKNKLALKHRVNLKKLINELINALKSTFPRTIKIEFLIDDNLHGIFCNSTDIYRSLLNICVNAREAIEHEGIINIVAQNIFLSVGNSEKLPHGDYVKIVISDSGYGIKAENIDNIFNQGFSTKIKNTESGLGLNIVKSFVESYNGQIFVTSNLGEGTQFTILLPALKKKQHGNSIKKIILLADDELIIRELLAELLESFNYTVLRACDGAEVIQKVDNFKNIDLLIIDRKMPVMDGIECIAQLKNNGFTTPIILASGSLLHDDDKKISDLKIDRILYKPYNFEEMKNIIEELIR